MPWCSEDMPDLSRNALILGVRQNSSGYLLIDAMLFWELKIT